ncbi:hypothetical protein [Metamycoplasma buccale]
MNKNKKMIKINHFAPDYVDFIITNFEKSGYTPPTFHYFSINLSKNSNL